MFRASWWGTAEIQGTLQPKRSPAWHGLGYYEDVDGKLWDVKAIIDGYICARPVQGDYYSTSTGASSNGFHEWLPYNFEVAEEGI